MTFLKQRTAHYRSIKESEYRNIPFALRSVGHYKAAKGWRDSAIVRDFIEVFWGIAGKGEFIRHNKRYVLGAEEVFLYFRGEKHLIKALSSTWEYRWCTFDGKLADAFVRELNFPVEVFRAGPCPEDLFLELETVNKDLTSGGLLQTSVLVHALLTAAKIGSSRRNAAKGLVEDYLRLVKEDFADETLNVNSAARRLGTHRTTLSRLFKESTHITPGTYLRRVRIQNAMQLLRHNNVPISEVGCRVGITDPCYFSKLFKNITGLSPNNFRRH